MMPKGSKLTAKQERFCLNLFQGMSQREAYVKAGYSANQSPAVLDVSACQLAKKDKINLRLGQLKKAAEDASIASILERKQVLSEIVRGRLSDFTGVLTQERLKSAALQEVKLKKARGKQKATIVRLHNPMQAIDLLNKMENVYQEAPLVNIDNRKVEIIVSSENAKRLTEKILKGERTE